MVTCNLTLFDTGENLAVAMASCNLTLLVTGKNLAMCTCSSAPFDTTDSLVMLDVMVHSFSTQEETHLWWLDDVCLQAHGQCAKLAGNKAMYHLLT